MAIVYHPPKQNAQAQWDRLSSQVNLPPWMLFEESIKNNEGRVVRGSNLAVKTEITSRIPEARFIVVETTKNQSIWWKHFNPLDEVDYLNLRNRVFQHLLDSAKLYTAFCTMGTQTQGFRFNVVSTLAWYANAARKIFYTPANQSSEASWQVIHAPNFQMDQHLDKSGRGVGIIINFTTQEILILGTSYFGELKIALHSATTYFFPKYDLLPLHAACNIDPGGYDGLAIVGLSGNGKSTTVNDEERRIYADDLVVVDVKSGHVVPLETGCHVKVYGLTQQDYLHKVVTGLNGAIFENVGITARGEIRFIDGASTNARVAFPLIHHPGGAKTYEPVTLRNIVFLCADISGVLPLLAKLTTPQAIYIFLNAPAARGVGVMQEGVEPTLKFATCFGPEMLTVDPIVHAKLLQQLCEGRGVQCWLVNSGWDGEGNRIPMPVTRAAVRAIARGQISEELVTLPITEFRRPLHCYGVEDQRLDPIGYWQNQTVYSQKAEELAEQIRDNAARKFGQDLSRWVYNSVGALAPKEEHFGRYPKRP